MGIDMRMTLLAALGVVVAGPVFAETYVCRHAVKEALMSYGIAADRVKSTSVYSRFMGDGDDGIHVGYRFWMRMKGCDKGYLIVDTDFVCQVEQTFTDGPCKIAGLPDC
jgi:hypothetical protein